MINLKNTRLWLLLDGLRLTIRDILVAKGTVSENEPVHRPKFAHMHTEIDISASRAAAADCYDVRHSWFSMAECHANEQSYLWRNRPRINLYGLPNRRFNIIESWLIFRKHLAQYVNSVQLYSSRSKRVPRNCDYANCTKGLITRPTRSELSNWNLLATDFVAHYSHCSNLNQLGTLHYDCRKQWDSRVMKSLFIK